MRCDVALGLAGQCGKARIREAHRFQRTHRALGLWQAVGADALLRLHDLLDLRDEPRVDLAGGVDLFGVEAEAQRLCHLQDTVRCRTAQSLADDVLVVALAEPFEARRR